MGNVFDGLDTSSKIKGVLASRGKTLSDLALLLQCTPDTITTRMKQNRWEVKELKLIADAFSIDTADLI